MIKDEFKFIRHNKLIMLSVFVIMFIPFLYSIFFLRSVWDPYGDTQELPVAVVNNDRAVTYQGKRLAVGAETVKQLKANKQLGWTFVSAKAAKAGMKANKYYTVVTIPRNFSKNATTVLTSSPKKMQLRYETNDSLNYLSQVISGIGVDRLDKEIRANVTNAYASAVFSQLHVIGGSMTKAATGATQIDDGLVKLDDGVSKYTVGVSTLKDGLITMKVQTAPLASGVKQLQDGSGQVASGAGKVASGTGTYVSGVNRVVAGLNQMNDAVGPLAPGVKKLVNGAQQVSTGVTAYTAGVAKLADGTQQMVDQTKTMPSQVKALASGADQVNAGVTSLQAGVKSGSSKTTTEMFKLYMAINKLKSSLDAQADDPTTKAAMTALTDQYTALQKQLTTQQSDLTTGLSALAAGSKQLDDGINTKLVPGVTALLGGVSQANDGAAALTSKNAELKAGASQVAGGLESVNKQVPVMINGLGQLVQGGKLLSANGGTLTAGTQQVASGAQQVAGGVNQLAGKVPTLLSGVDQLASGATTLADNSAALTSGTGKAQGGAHTLATGLTSGAKQVNGIKVTGKTADMFAAPTNTTQKHYSYVANYGHALAPYVLSLALYVGALVFNFAYPIRKVSRADGTPTQWFFSKITLGGLVAVGMAVIEATLIMVGGLTVANVGLFYGFAILFSLAAMYLVMFLSMLLDNPGRFIAMVLLMLQLGGAGGTFPLEITNRFYNVIHPWLPMSYSIMGFREAITAGIDHATVTTSAWFLVGTSVVSLLLLWASMIFLQHRHLMGVSQLDDNQKLQAVEK